MVVNIVLFKIVKKKGKVFEGRTNIYYVIDTCNEIMVYFYSMTGYGSYEL